MEIMLPVSGQLVGLYQSEADLRRDHFARDISLTSKTFHIVTDTASHIQSSSVPYGMSVAPNTSRLNPVSLRPKVMLPDGTVGMSVPTHGVGRSLPKPYLSCP
jgi:hypothetical protein